MFSILPTPSVSPLILWAKTTRDAPRSLIVEQFKSPLPEIHICILYQSARSLACLRASVLHQNNSTAFWENLIECTP